MGDWRDWFSRSRSSSKE